MEQVYDSTQDTKDHKNLVERYLKFLAGHLLYRGSIHDNSKLTSPEKEILDVVISKLKGCTFGTPEYEEVVKELDEYKIYHRKANRHHAGHFENGVKGMNLIDLNEMFTDWCGATVTHNRDSNIYRSIDLMDKKLGLGEVLVAILKNTARDFNMGKGEDEKGK